MTDKWTEGVMNAKVPETNSDFKEVPEGTYNAVIENPAMDLTGDVPKVKLRFRINNTEYENSCVFKTYTLNKKGYDWLVKDFRKLNLDPAKFKTELEFGEKLSTLTDRLVEIYCTPKEYNGKMYTNVYLNKTLDVPSREVKNYADDIKAPSVDEKEPLPF